MKAPNRRSISCFVGLLASAALASVAGAQSEGSSRGVRIIEGPGVIEGPGPNLQSIAPSPPPSSKSELPPSDARPALQLDSSRPTPVAPAPSKSGTLTNLPASPVDSGAARPPVDHNALNQIKIVNPAELSIEILPGQDIADGSVVSFRISTKKPGYLILVDVDPTGKLTQIYPNPISLMARGSVRDNVNFIRPGKALQIPNSTDVHAGFEFVASPPYGTGLVVAFLSDVPVQRVDLPDIPDPLIGQSSALAYIMKIANELRVPQVARAGRLQEVRWSIDAKFYSIR